MTSTDTSFSKSFNINYGIFPCQYIRISLPETPIKCPIVIIIHGGFWKEKYCIDNSAIELIPPHCLEKGCAVCEIEYRRVPDEKALTSSSASGGWPSTHIDILNALIRLKQWNDQTNSDNGEGKDAIDLTRSVLVGHSAGGNLALWACATGIPNVLSDLTAEGAIVSLRQRFEIKSDHSTLFGFTPLAVVAVAPVADMLAAHLRKLSDQGDAVQRYIGVDPASPEFLEACRRSSPTHLSPILCDVLIVAGGRDTDVPPEFVRESFDKFSAVLSPSSSRSGHLQVEETAEEVVRSQPEESFQTTEQMKQHHESIYLSSIQSKLPDQPEIYRSFLNIIQKYHQERTSREVLLEQISLLFADYPDLVTDSPYFLPKDDRIKERMYSAARESEMFRQEPRCRIDWLLVPDADHYQLVQPCSAGGAWDEVMRGLDAMLGGSF